MIISHANYEMHMKQVIEASLERTITSLSALAESYMRPYFSLFSQNMMDDLRHAGLTQPPEMSPPKHAGDPR